MDLNSLLALLHQFLPADLWDRGLKFIGLLALITQAAPWLLAKGVPAATRAADWLANLMLNSPLKPLILWKATDIITFLDDFTAALEKVADTFRSRLEADIKAAEPQKQSSTETPVNPVAPKQ